MDGVPLTSLSAGLANWDIIPVVAVRAIEVMPGSSSALYGEGALGGVINIITSAPIQSPARWLLTTGQYGTVDGSGAWSGSQGERQASVFGGYRHSDGFRAHEHGELNSIGGSADLYRSERESVAFDSRSRKKVRRSRSLSLTVRSNLTPRQPPFLPLRSNRRAAS
jgi:iron complex outermembrane receptor protein